MRIIAGQFKGRRFHPPADNWPTRPTTDFAKEGLFNILANRLDSENLVALDLFGGTGNHCFELISRGARKVTYVDKHRPAVLFVKKLATELKIEAQITIINGDVRRFLLHPAIQFDYIFAGPPYPLPWIPEIPDLIFDHGWLNTNGLFVLETNPQHRFDQHPRFRELRTYGKTHFSFFS